MVNKDEYKCGGQIHDQPFQMFSRLYTSKLLKSVHFDQVNKELKCRNVIFRKHGLHMPVGWLE